MKKLSLRNKILSVIALLLCIVIIGATVHLITTVTSANKSSAGEDLSDFDVVFSGKINLLEEDYDILLKGKGGAFTVDANNMKGIMEYVDDEVVSGDFRGDTNTSIFDARQGIQLTDRFFKLVAYYDNEFGYSAKMLELAKHMYEVDNR